jgi:UDP-GlcNAc:undecaprenyl-phosphate GlcNAc-1-phosphate transferase
MFQYGLLWSIAAGLGLLFTPYVRLLALWLGAIDEPGERRVHAQRIPRLGGLAIMAAFLCSLLFGLFVQIPLVQIFSSYGWQWRWSLAGALVVFCAGAADDIWSLSPTAKIGCQFLAGGCAVIGGHGVGMVANPFTGGSFAIGWVSLPLTLGWVVAVTNALNLIDGLDGLATGVALIALATLGAVSVMTGRADVTLLVVTLAGGLSGFLYYNFQPAAIFLGDSGSFVLGYLLAVLSLQVARQADTGLIVLVPLLTLGLPMLDTLLALVRRFPTRRFLRQDTTQPLARFFSLAWIVTLFTPDQDHIHHRLLRRGFTHRNAVLTLYSVCVFCGLVAFLVFLLGGLTSVILGSLTGVLAYYWARKLGY